MGFTPSLIKKRITELCSSLAHVAKGPQFLRYYCAVVLHSCIVLPPVGHSSNHQYHCCQLTRQSSCCSIFIALLRFSFDSPSYFSHTIGANYFPYHSPATQFKFSSHFVFTFRRVTSFNTTLGYASDIAFY